MNDGFGIQRATSDPAGLHSLAPRDPSDPATLQTLLYAWGCEFDARAQVCAAARLPAPRLGQGRFPLSLAKSPSVVRETGRTVSRAAAPGGASGRCLNTDGCWKAIRRIM